MIQKLESTFEGSGEVKGYTFTRLREVKYGYVYEVTEKLPVLAFGHGRLTTFCGQLIGLIHLRNLSGN